jgi:hypothetical protein
MEFYDSEVSVISAHSVPSPVLVSEYLVRDALADGESLQWCECCEVWFIMVDDHGFALPTCWCA